MAHTIDCVCSKINHGLNHGLFISLFKLIPCPIHWIVYVLAYVQISYLNFKAVLALPKTAGSAQTHRSISFIWIVWSTLYVYLWLQVYLILTQSKKTPQTMKHWKPIHFILIIVTYIITLSIMTNFRIEVKKLVLHVYLILTQSKQNFKHWNTKGMKKIFMLENTIFFSKMDKSTELCNYSE